MAVNKLICCYLLPLLALSFFRCFSQESMVACGIEKKSVIITHDAGLNSGDQSMLILRDLALATESNVSEIKIKIDLDIEYQILSNQDHEYILRILPVNINLYALYYKDFNISTWIKPSEIAVEFMISDTLGVPLKLVQGKFHPGQSPDWHFLLNRNYTHLKAEIIEVQCLINKKSYEHFTEGLLLINNYYAASQAVDVIHENLENIFDTEASLTFRSVEYIEALRTLGFIRIQDFSGLQISDGWDQAGLDEKLKKIDRLMTKCRTIL